MGNKQCAELTSQTTRKSPAYGQYQLIINRDHQYAIVSKSIDKNIITKKQLQIELQRRKKINSAHLVNLCSYQIAQDEYFIDIKLQYQYISLTLTEKINVWKSMNKTISETQISNILLGVQDALNLLYKIGIGHRCVNFDTILCFNSLYKLSDISMITFLTGYDLARQGDESQFLNNNLLDYLHYQGTDPQYEIEDDLFSLAMIILTIVLKCKPKDLYITMEGHLTKLNRNKIDQGLKIMSLNYSNWIVKKMKTFLFDGLKEEAETAKESSRVKHSFYLN